MFGVFGRICYFGCKCDVFKSSVGVLYSLILHLHLIFANAALLWSTFLCDLTEQ